MLRWAAKIIASALIVFLSLLPISIPSGETDLKLPPLREQAEIQQQWLRLRLERVLPILMRRHGVAIWLVICREYHEDPVFRSLASPTLFAARRRTILLFYDRGPEKGIERIALGGGSNGGLYQVYQDPAIKSRELYGEEQWTALRRVIAERNPATIAVNISQTHAFSDGLSSGEREKLEQTLGPQYLARVIRAELLPLEFLEIRLPEMQPIYRKMMEIVHSLIAVAFSDEVIKPGRTTNHDVVWWLRQRVSDMGLGTWFHPTVRVQRKGKGAPAIVGEDSPVVIKRGDVLHVDFGISAMGLNTDTQHMGYVLRERETDVPVGIKRALAVTNRLQDLLIEHMRVGRTGNEVLADTLSAMRAAKINGLVYTHPIGDHGHGAGPLIGLWDHQEGVPGRGDVKLLPNTWFSIELSARTPVPEWDGQELFVGQEEDAMLDGDGKFAWVLGRQTNYHLVK